MSKEGSPNLKILQRELRSVLRKDHGPEDQFGTLLSYIGPVDSAGMEGLLALAEKSTAAAGGRTLMKRIGNVLIECLQNVMRHGLIEEDGFTQLYLTLESTPIGFQLQCGNMVDTPMRNVLSDRLAEINGMDEERIRKAYIETLCNGELSSKGGAGLGLLSLAKKANGPIDYRFDSLEGERELFTLIVTIRRN
jgi:hypothetical protein